MRKKQLVYQLNNQKGVTGADVVIALLIILTAVGVISMLYVNLVIGSRETDRKAGATRIATNMIENMSQMYYDEITEHLENLVQENKAEKQENTYIITKENSTKVFETNVPNGYGVEIMLNEVGDYDLVKKVTTTVKFKVDGQDKKVQLNKVLTRETVRECNSPNFSESYIAQMTTDNWEFYTENSQNASGVKIICPIQYDKSSESYQIVTNRNSLWYSYSNKQWARVLILEPNQLENITEEMLTGENSYIWVPRFGIQVAGNLFGDTYFKYKTTDYAISNSYDKNQINFIYHSIDKTKMWAERVNFEQDLVGMWCPYSDLAKDESMAYILNQSQYGPMLEY